MRVKLALLLIALLAAPATAGHLADGSYRCDGGWCRDGDHHVLHCTDGGCRGETGDFTTIVDPRRGDGAELADDAWVLGVEVDGHAVAYPIKIISGHQGWELILDDVAGVEIMATYCPLCASGIAYKTEVDGRNLTFRNSGAIWKHDMVMYDVETESLWSQVAGEAIHGPMEGKRLELLDQSMTRWASWKDTHPDTEAAQIPRDPDGEPLCSCPSVSLEPASLIHGIEVDGQALGLPHETVREAGIARVAFADRSLVATFRGDAVHVFDAGNRTLYQSDDGRWIVDQDGRRYDPVTGQAEDGQALEKIPGKTTFRHRWELFHPDSQYYQGGGQLSSEPPDGPGPSLPGPAVPAAGLALLLAAWTVSRRRRKPPSCDALS